MSHWFHRNPIKATARTTFDCGLAAATTSAKQICSDAASKRNKLMDILCDPNLDISIMVEALTQYLSALVGFVCDLDQSEGSSKTDHDSKLRNAVKFRWTNSLSVKGDPPVEHKDSIFEICNMLVNVALWYTKHAAKLAANENVSMDQAKEVHKCLRAAAGIFKTVMSHFAPRLPAAAQSALPKDGQQQVLDTDLRILEAYIHQCTAEAQEVTMARAVELEHSPSLISSLAFETAKMFQSADLSLNGLDAKVISKWSKYLQFKQACYQAYAYSYHGEQLLKEDKCGEAIASLNESMKFYKKSQTLASEYGKAPGVGLTVKPHEHLFYRKLEPFLRRTLDKCERENGLIYHQKVPSEIPELNLKATHGLVAPEEFTLPEPCETWKSAYKGFDASHILLDKIKQDNDKSSSSKNSNKSSEDSGPIPPVKEKPIYQTDKDPGNNSGCVVS